MHKTVPQILRDGDVEELLALFTFKADVTVEELIAKFNLWSRYFFPQYFKSDDAPFHRDIDEFHARLYLGHIRTFTDLGFRGCAKTTRTKLFFAFVIANDQVRRRRYLKILSKDGGNSKQSVTDIYNMLIDSSVHALYPEIFEKTDAKREETMEVFTTATGVRLLADTVGTDQRGQLQDDARPDFIWFDDFETRTTLSSAVTTKKIWDNMEEAKTGLAKEGGVIYTGNYLSERGNVHKLVEKESEQTPVLNTPIRENGLPTWPARYTLADIAQIEADVDDFEGEYLGKPSASKDIIFDRERLDAMVKRVPLKEVAGQRIYRAFNASHRYGAGADVAGGVGLDASTSVIIDFDTVPAQVVATYVDNTVKPDIFGDELARHGQRFGECLLAPEKNNHGHATIGRLKQIYPTDFIYRTQRADPKVTEVVGLSSAEYGWHTNALTKPKMIFAFAKAVEDGLVELNDPRLIAECRSYTRNDLMDPAIDVRLATRHFDLLVAACIAWQLKDSELLKVHEEEKSFKQPVAPPSSEYEGDASDEPDHIISKDDLARM